jgi:hypothetical protein
MERPQAEVSPLASEPKSQGPPTSPKSKVTLARAPPPPPVYPPDGKIAASQPNAPNPPPGDIVEVFDHPPLRRPLKQLQPIPQPRLITSYNDLFNRKYDDDRYFLYDKYVTLFPGNRRAYITNASFTVHDFHKYAWLLAQSEERWYTMPTVSELAEMKKWGLKELTPMEDPKPAALDTPCIMASEVFTLLGDIVENVEENIWGDCETLHPDNPVTPSETLSLSSSASSSPPSEEKRVPFNVRNKWACPICYDKRRALDRDIGWVYLSVVRTEARGPGSPQGNGTGMFMLKRHGNREGAAATAFCDAGTRGWSTVFACAIRSDVQLLGWKGKVLSTTSVEDVLILKEGVLTVCY